MAGQGSAAKAILYAFVANLGIAIAKLAASIYTNSGSMLAEAIHSFADAGNQVLLWLGLKQSQRPADAQHPMGYGKLSYFWSFIVAILLFSMGGLFSIYEGWHKLHEPEVLNKPWVALVVLAVAIVLESGSLYGALREIKKMRGSKSLHAWLRTTRNAELVVVFGEDVAALLGLVIAFGFVSAATITHDPRLDAVGSISIGVVLIIVSIFVAVRIRGLLVGRSAEEELQAGIRDEIAKHPSIENLLNAITLQLGPQVMLAAKVKMRPGIEIGQAVAEINRLEQAIKAHFPEIAWSFIEPDVVD
ncbi:MAG TPA: cation diffusion facilitator family transporter [Steroidobacteraceae bacterium]|nr:cation diffusion facilitator family transporter [Steroidobacteraceae bacterium]